MHNPPPTTTLEAGKLFSAYVLLLNQNEHSDVLKRQSREWDDVIAQFFFVMQTFIVLHWKSSDMCGMYCPLRRSERLICRPYQV